MIRKPFHIGRQLLPPLLSILVGTLGVAQEPGEQGNHVVRTRALLEKLHWHDDLSQSRYLATKDDVTQSLLKEVDGYITESFQPKASTVDRIRAGLSAALGSNTGNDVSRSKAVTRVDLPPGRFLIVGIELWRGGPAIEENAVSFRAYRDTGDRFAFVSNLDDLHSSDSRNDSLGHLCFQPLSPSPNPDEFWFFALARASAQSPPTVAIRLYAFDGDRFRTVWSREDILSEGPDKVVEVTDSGFTITRLFDPTGRAAHSPSVVIHEQYTVSRDGVYKSGEWRSDRQ